MKNNKGFIAAGVLVFIYILSGIIAGGFSYVAVKDVTSKVKCGSFDCADSSVQVSTNATAGNGGNLAGGVQNGG